MSEQHDETPEFERGRAVGRRESVFPGVPSVPGWTHGTKLQFRRSWFDTFCDYERALVEDLRRVQQRRQVVQRELAAARNRCDDASASRGRLHSQTPHRLVARLEKRYAIRRGARTIALLMAEVTAHERRAAGGAALQHNVERELRVVREAVDAELHEGRGRARLVAALRADPVRPLGVREYASVDDFVAEDPRRALADWPARRDAGGADYGYKWGLENPIQRWEVTRWRISWLGIERGIDEVYAIELPRWLPDESGSGRVWLLGVIRSADVLHSALGALELDGQGERNSLVAAADAVMKAAEEERGADSIAA